MMDQLLMLHDIKPTKNRLCVAKYLNDQEQPVTAPEMLTVIQQQISINKVTLYRILDLFEAHGMVLKHRADDRTFRYCLKESEQTAHCHFLCTECGTMACVSPETVGINPELIQSNSYQISNVEIRIDGVCDACNSH